MTTTELTLNQRTTDLILTPDEARALIGLLCSWYEGRTIGSELSVAHPAVPEYTAAEKLATLAGVSLTDPCMQWALLTREP